MKNKHKNNAPMEKLNQVCGMCSSACKGMKNLIHKLMSKLGHRKSGFTLIELLIVISIIGILAVSLLPSVLGAPARARDAARKTDVNNIIAGIESFYAANGRYPDLGSTGCIDPGNSSDDMGILNSLFKGGKAPVPPTGAPGGCTKQYFYCTLPSPNSYYVAAEMETDGSTKGYRANGPTAGSCESLAGEPDALGKFYVNVQ